MDGPGRPTLYQPELAERALKLCLAGATNEELADHFEVNRTTIDRWLQKHAGFAEAVKQGREVADGSVAQKLYSRAVGYTYETTKVLLYRGEPVTVPHAVHYPPDIQACIFWLRNRRRRQWLEKAVPQDEGPEWASELEAAAERARHADDE